MLNFLLLGLGLTTFTTAAPTPEEVGIESDAPTLTSGSPGNGCLGPNLLRNSGFETGSPFPAEWGSEFMGQGPPLPTPPQPHVPYPITNVAHTLPTCGVDNSACYQVFWPAVPGSPEGLVGVSQQGYQGGFMGEQGKKYELSVAYKLEKSARRDANLTCWVSNAGTWTPPRRDQWVVTANLGNTKVGKWRFKKGHFNGFVDGQAINTVGCDVWFGPGGFDSVIDIDNVEVREKKC